jgi:hypothetical protein
MKGERIKAYMLQRPFVPFDIKTSDGRVYLVDHPEFVALSRKMDMVMYVTPEDDRVIWIDAANILSLETANRPTAA